MGKYHPEPLHRFMNHEARPRRDLLSFRWPGYLSGASYHDTRNPEHRVDLQRDEL